MFEPVKLEWNGKSVIIPASRLLGAIAAVEDVVTFNELLVFSQRQAYPTAHVAAAYGVLLRYAGEAVTDEDVYAAIFGDPALTFDAGQAIQVLMMMMVPPHLRNGEKPLPPVTAPGERVVGKRRAASRKKSSKPTTMRSSAKGGARR